MAQSHGGHLECPSIIALVALLEGVHDAEKYREIAYFLHGPHTRKTLGPISSTIMTRLSQTLRHVNNPSGLLIPQRGYGRPHQVMRFSSCDNRRSNVRLCLHRSILNFRRPR